MDVLKIKYASSKVAQELLGLWPMWFMLIVVIRSTYFQRREYVTWTSINPVFPSLTKGLSCYNQSAEYIDFLAHHSYIKLIRIDNKIAGDKQTMFGSYK